MSGKPFLPVSTPPAIAQARRWQAAGRCKHCGALVTFPYHTCLPCRTDIAAQGRIREEGKRRARAAATHESAGPNLVAHCGSFWEIGALPFPCPRCQKQIFDKASVAAACTHVSPLFIHEVLWP